VARQVAKQEQGSDHFMWAELALFWENVADYKAFRRSAAAAATTALQM
jgi:hypothetical protein